MNAATPSGAFGIYAVFCAAAWVFCLLCYPETSGLSLEEVFEVFVDDFGVHRSMQMRKEKKGFSGTSRYA
jgi:SP family myo-inositol transporter-like MFS transporter 13